MRYRDMGVLAATAVTIGLAGFAVTGCQNLDIGTSIQPDDTLGTPGLDDPGATSPGNNIIPIEESSLELERIAPQP